MPYRYNPWTGKPDYYERSTGSSSPGASQITPLSLVFSETFTGDGSSFEYSISGNVDNATFSNGQWIMSRVKASLPSHITDLDGKPIYDSNNLFSRNRISVDNIDISTGIVTLDYPPQLLQDFKIWYWYNLRDTDVLSKYYRTDFVSSMESDMSSSDLLPAAKVAVDTSAFDGRFSTSEDTAQKIFDLLDNQESGIIITDTIVEDIDLSSFYIGYAIDHALQNEPHWQIRKVVETGDVIDIYFANGTEAFDKIWLNRALYTYS